MIFPFGIKKTLVLDKRIYGISSESYLLNFISDYMRHFKMEEERGEDYLSYRKRDIWRMIRAKDAIRNVVYRVEIVENDIRITIEMQTIFEALIAIVPLFVFPFILATDDLPWFLLTIVACSGFIIMSRYMVLKKLYKEIKFITSKLRRI
jgi:hypothetical protein